MRAFEVYVNGERVCVAAVPGGVTTVIFGLLRRQSVRLHVGGVGRADERHSSWLDAEMKVGDSVTVRLVDAEAVDPPAAGGRRIRGGGSWVSWVSRAMNSYLLALLGTVLGLGTGALAGDLLWTWVWFDYYLVPRVPPRPLPEALAEAFVRGGSTLAGTLSGATAGYFARLLLREAPPPGDLDEGGAG